MKYILHDLFINLIKLNYDRNHFKTGMILNQTMDVLDEHPAPERGELEDKLVKIPKNNLNKNENYSL